MNFEQEILKAQLSQEFNVNRQIAGTDEHDFIKSMFENLYTCSDRECFDKSWSGDLQKRFPNGGWRTVNGSRVFINGGKVVAGLGGFNGMIDKFFEEKESKDKISFNDLSAEEQRSLWYNAVGKDGFKGSFKEFSGLHKDKKIPKSLLDSVKNKIQENLKKVEEEKVNNKKTEQPKPETDAEADNRRLLDFFKLVKDSDYNKPYKFNYKTNPALILNLTKTNRNGVELYEAQHTINGYLAGGLFRGTLGEIKKEMGVNQEEVKAKTNVDNIEKLALQSEKDMQDKIKEIDQKKKDDNSKGDLTNASVKESMNTKLRLSEKDKQLADDYGYSNLSKKELINEKNKIQSYIDRNTKNYSVVSMMKDKKNLIERRIAAHEKLEDNSGEKLKSDKSKIWGME